MLCRLPSHIVLLTSVLQTRISTRYRLSRPPGSEPPARPRGTLVLKTYDPVSGACLKYRTRKAAEVGRLVAGMQRCARVMAAVPLLDEADQGASAAAAAHAAADESASVGAPVTAAPSAGGAGSGSAGAAGNGAAKKKKKGKR